MAGLRRGVGEFELRLIAVPEGTRIESIARGEELHLQGSSLALLVAGGLGGLTLLAWPFFPGFLVLAPMGIVAALAAWLIVVQRLRNSGLEDFLEEVRQAARE